jgi:hypothetical protein
MNGLALRKSLPIRGGTVAGTWRFKLSELDEWMQRRINSVRRPPLSERTVKREKEAH